MNFVYQSHNLSYLVNFINLKIKIIAVIKINLLKCYIKSNNLYNK